MRILKNPVYPSVKQSGVGLAQYRLAKAAGFRKNSRAR
jgi:hypothetical protein